MPEDISADSDHKSVSSSDDEDGKKSEEKQEKKTEKEPVEESKEPVVAKKSSRKVEEEERKALRQPSESKLVESKEDLGRFKMWVYRPHLIDGKNKRRIRLQSVNSLRKRKQSLEIENL